MTGTTPTPEQILSDPHSGTRAALDYCNGEMANCLKVTDEQADRIADLEAQNEALRTVVAAWGDENDTGSLTLQDALDAVELLKVARQVADNNGRQPEGHRPIFRSTYVARLAELERREALLTAVVVAQGAVDSNVSSWELRDEHVLALRSSWAALSEAGFTADGWGDG